MAIQPNPIVACAFRVRTKAKYNRFEYVDLDVDNVNHDGYLYTVHPPEVGDDLWLVEDRTKRGAEYRIVSRKWTYSQYGSANWPLGERYQDTPALLTLIVDEVPADGWEV